MSSSVALRQIQEMYPDLFGSFPWIFCQPTLGRTSSAERAHVLVPGGEGKYDEASRQYIERVERHVNIGLGCWVFPWLEKKITGLEIPRKRN